MCAVTFKSHLVSLQLSFFVKIDLNDLSRGGDTARCYSACLAWVRAWVPPTLMIPLLPSRPAPPPPQDKKIFQFDPLEQP